MSYYDQDAPLVTILSSTDPVARKRYLCSWSSKDKEHFIEKGKRHKKICYIDDDDPKRPMKSERVCYSCFHGDGFVREEMSNIEGVKQV